MSDLKFACPHCHQHIQCDAKHAGREISCPSCRAALRIPRAPAPGPKLTEATLLAPPQVKTQPIKTTETQVAMTPPRPSKVPSVQGPPKREKKEEEPVRDRPAAPSVEPPGGAQPAAAQPAVKMAKPTKVETRPQAIHCVCPVCQSELRVPAGPVRVGPGQPPPMAELVRQGKTPSSPQPAAAAAGRPAVQKSDSVKTETQAGRAQAAQPGGEMKPRLSYILTGKPPAGATNLEGNSTDSSSAKPKKKEADSSGKEEKID